MPVSWASAWAVAWTLPGVDRGRAGLGHLLEHLALVGGIALHGFDQIGDEVGAAAQLDGDPAEPFLDQRAQADQPVVDAHCPEQQQDDECHSAQPMMPM